MHVPPSGPAHPALHWQSVSASLPVAECELTGQAAHAIEPVSFLYVSTAHAVHGNSSAIVMYASTTTSAAMSPERYVILLEKPLPM